MSELKVGQHAPDFTLPLATFGTVSLSNMRGKPVILYFYPKDDTPGCTVEACAFRDNLPKFGDFDAAIIGISKDSVESHAAFAKKFGIKFHLASDEHSNTCETYGVWTQKNNYGTKYMGIERTTFLIDRHGVIRHIWRRVHVEGHAAEVLKLVEMLHLGQPLPGDRPPEPPPALPAPAKPEPAKAKAAAPAKPVAAASKPAKKPEPPKKAEPKKVAAKAPAKKPAKPAPKPTAKPAVKAKASAKSKTSTPKAKPASKPATKKPAAKAKPAPKKPVKKAAKPKPAKKVVAKKKI